MTTETREKPMHDRVVDRAALHATPALLAVRDRLLVTLAFASGIYEAICFLSFGKVFTAFQTGNIVFLGVGAAGTRPPAGPNPIAVIVSLAAFAAGAVVAVLILKAFNGDEEVADRDIFEVWPRRVSITLGLALIVQVGFLVVWMAAPRTGAVVDVLVGMSGFAMGMQMNAIRSLHVPGISTTAVTATFISLVSGAATWSLAASEVRRLLGVLVFMAFGAFVGNWMLNHEHTYAPLVPVVVIGAVIAIASVALKQERGVRTR
jgi:uncharacterized membrane protein YoaK (UPF0700 family)